MPEIKNTFLGGKMNKDLDERLIPKNEYRDALNVEVSTSQGDDVGALQNTFGNTAHSALSEVLGGGKCVGSIVDKENDKIYWFIHGSKADAIAEYDFKTRIVSPVVVDYGMADTTTQTFSSASLNPSSGITSVVDSSSNVWTNNPGLASTSAGVSWSITGGVAVAIGGRVGRMQLFADEINLTPGCKYEIQYDVNLLDDNTDGNSVLIHHGINDANITLDVDSSGTKKTQWIQGESYLDRICIYSWHPTNDKNPFSLDNITVRQVNRFLNFDSINFITGINILDGMLFWTDGVNEPKKINIERCKAGSYGVSNFGESSFIGKELITNGSFDIDANWVSAGDTAIANGWSYNSDKYITGTNVTSGHGIHQKNVTIKKGQAYLFSFDLSSVTSGELAFALVDEFSNRTIYKSSINSNGTHSATIVAGVEENEYITIQPNYSYSSGVYIVSCDNASDFNGIIDNVSVKEVAFDWNRTTKVKGSNGQYSRDLKEEDITLIKKYPLNAPDMEMFNSTRGIDAVIKTTCETPIHTTFNGARYKNDASGDRVLYNNFLHAYLKYDAYLPNEDSSETSWGNAIGDYGNQMIQIDIVPSWDQPLGTSGTDVQYPVFSDEQRPYWIRKDLYNSGSDIVNKFTTDPDYPERAWQEWVGQGRFTNNHFWVMDENGDYSGESSGIALKDLFGGRLYVKSSVSSTLTDGMVAGTHPFLEKLRAGRRIVIGYWSWKNNNSFWTYIDGDGNLLPKPPGTKNTESHAPDGSIVVDEYGGSGLDSPNILSPDEKIQSESNDFGGGWSVVDGKYVGTAFTSANDGTVGDVYNSNGNNLGLNVDSTSTDGWQYIHSIAKGLRPNTTYYVDVTITLITLGTNPNGDMFGISNQDATANFAINSAKNIGSSNTNASLGHRRLTYHFTTPKETSFNTHNVASASLSIYKRDGVELTVDSFIIDHKRSNPILIQPLVFSPKPSYEVGDLVKMTNVKKAPNGDDITVTVKLLEEIENGSTDGKMLRYVSNAHFGDSSVGGMQAPKTWGDITFGSDMVFDSDFSLLNSSEATNIGNLGDRPDGTPINPTFSGGPVVNSGAIDDTTDWSTTLNMVENGNFELDCDNGTSSEEKNNWATSSPTSINGFIYSLTNPSGWSVTNGNTVSWPNIKQTITGNPKLMFEEGGEYSLELDYTQQLLSGASGASNGMRIRIENSQYYLYSNWTGSTSNTTNATLTDTLTWSSANYSAVSSGATGFSAQDITAIRIIADTEVNEATNALASGVVKNIRFKANNNTNRVSWGTQHTTKCVVRPGTCSQVISYPANPDGSYNTGQSGNFTLEDGAYYKLRYRVHTNNLNSDLNNQVKPAGMFMKLFNHNQKTTAGRNDGHINMNLAEGYHDVYWKQSGTVNQLSILLGPALDLYLDNISVYKADFTSVSYGASGSNSERKVFASEIVSIDNNIVQLPIEDHTNWNCELVDEEPLFKNVFPRFAYRWKYQDGEYSSMSAFTEVAFLPDNTYNYDAVDGYNLSMENTVRRIKLNAFDIKPHDVTEIDILYKESNSNNIYTLTTIKGSELESFTEYVITKEKFHALIDSKQILRPYDNVPRKALAQEISANRIIFGNYTQQYDITPSDEPNLSAFVSTAGLLASEQVSRSIKSIREYQVGVSYLDYYGRQSPVFSKDTALISIDQQNSITANTINASISNFLPDYVTHYKYYVKDSASSFYNISLDRFYQAEQSNHVWLSFPSSDFNKLKEDDYLVLKKKHNDNDGLIPSKTIKYKVLAVKGNAPSFIKMTRKRVGGKTFNIDGKGLHFFSQTDYGGSADGYPQVDKMTFRLRGDVVHADKAIEEAFIDDQTGRYIRIGREINNKPSLFSNYYEILHISRVAVGDTDFEDKEDYYEITLVKPLAFDASFVGKEYSSSRKLFLEYYREELNEFDNNFEGKFFVKIAKDTEFDINVGGKQKIEDEGFNIINAQDTHWAFAYENVANTASDKGQDTDVWLRDDDNFKWNVFASSNAYSTANTSGRYNGVDVPYFPALNDDTVDIAGTSRTNPYIADWVGTVHKDDWAVTSQRFVIHQAMTWYWSSSYDAYEGQPSSENPNIGSGFITGNDYCSFAFIGIGEIDTGDGGAVGNAAGTTASSAPTSTSAIDTNTWYDGADGELSPQWFTNYKLLTQLTKPGTQFRWQDDPTNTIYTILKVMQEHKITNYDAQLDDGKKYGTSVDGKILDKSASNFGYRIDLQLDRSIAWSPTATISSGFGTNQDNGHSPLNAMPSSTNSQIQIVERRPSELTHTSFNPAVFEILPKERAELNLYYETPKANMVIKSGMFIEALNNTLVNDTSISSVPGNYITADDVGTPYMPDGGFALPYAQISKPQIVRNASFDITTDWTDNDTTSTFDTVNSSVLIESAATSVDFPFFYQELDALETGKTYQLLIDVLEMDNDVNLIGSPLPTKAVIQDMVTSDRPLPGSNPALNVGINTWTFECGVNPNDMRVFIELTNSNNNLDKMIRISEISIKEFELDTTKPLVSIKRTNFNPNAFTIPTSLWNPQSQYYNYTPGKDLPAGITLRISERDENGDIIYYKDFINPQEQICDGSNTTVSLSPQALQWHNCFTFGNGVESNRLRDDFNAVTIDKGPRVSTTLEQTYLEEKKGSGLIFSGIYNSTSSVNQLNQFIQAESITKDLNPEYGTIQKLFTRNTNIVALCENKILKVLANKDALFNADGSMQVTSTNKVLGQAIPFVGEYGISRNPESFANFGYRIYFTDRDRGAVLRLSADGLTPISDKDMISYFKSKLPNSNTIIGSYDENRDSYDLTFEDISVSFSEKVNGWTSFKSYLPESGVSLNGEYYTWKNGDIWKHHSNARRNNFYNRQYESTVNIIFNDNVDEVKHFNTLNYEGSQSRINNNLSGSDGSFTQQGWYSSLVKTDLEEGEVVSFVDKENKKFSNITGISKTEESILVKDFTTQGLGVVGDVNTGSHPNYKTLCISSIPVDQIPEVNAVDTTSGVYYDDGTPHFEHPFPTDIVYAQDVENTTTGFTVEGFSEISWISHNDAQTSAEPESYYTIGLVDLLKPGNTYYIEADIENFSGAGSCGFSSANMSDWFIAGADTRKRSSNGKIFVKFTYDDNKWSNVNQAFGEDGVGIHFFKQHGTSGTVKNIKCINITPKIDDLTYVVNSSPTDRTSTISEIKENIIVNPSTPAATINKYFYIHGQTINGVKRAVDASSFSVVTSSESISLESITDLGTGTNAAGYYGNVVEIKLSVNYNSANPFPNKNVDAYINVTGVTALAIDQ